jgi:hypothetical protein
MRDGMGVADIFRLTRKPTKRRANPPLTLEKEIASYDRANGRGPCGWTPAELQRASLYADCVYKGLEPTRVAFAAWLHEHRGMEG